MLTVNADGHDLMKRFHKPEDEKRMVVILEPEMYRPWINGTLSAEEIAGLLRTYPAEQLTAAAAPVPPRKRKDAVPAT
jgi:putative SOS response-associated peptidase YedK